MEIVLVTDKVGLEKLIGSILTQRNEVIRLANEAEVAEINLDLEKANRAIAIKDADPKATVVAIESKIAAEFEVQDKEVIAKKKLYKEAEAELEAYENTFSASKRLMDIAAK